MCHTKSSIQFEFLKKQTVKVNSGAMKSSTKCFLAFSTVTWNLRPLAKWNRKVEQGEREGIYNLLFNLSIWHKGINFAQSREVIKRHSLLCQSWQKAFLPEHNLSVGNSNLATVNFPLKLSISITSWRKQENPTQLSLPITPPTLISSLIGTPPPPLPCVPGIILLNILNFHYECPITECEIN